MTTPTLEGGTHGGLLDDHIQPFLKHLRAAGYAERTLRNKRTVARAFSRWTRRKQIAGSDLSDGHITAFVARSPRRRKAHVKFELATMRLFFEYLRCRAGLQRPALQNDVSEADALLQNYKDHLRKDRGLTENSVLVYAPFIRDFLAAQTTQAGRVSPDLLDTLIVRDFILEHTVDRSSEYARLLCTALRPFFRFLLLCGQTSRDLSNAVPMFRKYRQSVPPAFLSPSEVEQVLAATGSPLSGRRDHAILLLLARLGLRGGEVVALELADIRWRAGAIVVRGKGRMVDHCRYSQTWGENDDAVDDCLPNGGPHPRIRGGMHFAYLGYSRISVQSARSGDGRSLPEANCWGTIGAASLRFGALAEGRSEADRCRPWHVGEVGALGAGADGHSCRAGQAVRGSARGGVGHFADSLNRCWRYVLGPWWICRHLRICACGCFG